MDRATRHLAGDLVTATCVRMEKHGLNPGFNRCDHLGRTGVGVT